MPEKKKIFEYHYLNDMSFSEIGEELKISRQAVRDLLKRTEAILYGYENKLKLVEKFIMQKKQVKLIKDLAFELMNGCSVDNDYVNKVQKIMKIADDILD